MSDVEKDKKLEEMGLNEDEISQVHNILENIIVEVKDGDLTAILEVKQYSFKVKPLKRGLAKKFSKFLTSMQDKEKRGIAELDEFGDILEACLISSVTSIRVDGKPVILAEFDWDDMDEPDFDLLGLYFNRYYVEYKKKSITTT